jgi:serine/threonine-protein kinase
LPNIGRFEVERELGRIGQGVVFLAYDPMLRRRVSLKVPHPGLLLDDDARRRFRREAEIVARLDHPNLLPVHEVVEDGTVLYLVTAYYPGPTLSACLEGRNTGPPAEAARFVAVLARTVAYVHAKGVLHRDIKPTNILLQTSDEADESRPSDRPLGYWLPKFTDFGLAKWTDTATQATRDGALLGTPRYMAPEQTDARHGAIGPAANVHALGLVLYELLTGRTPCDWADVVDTVRRVVAVPPIAPRRLRSEVPRDLETLCLTCLEKDPRRRYSTADALANDLTAFLAGDPIRASRVQTWDRTVRWVRRRPAVVVGIACALLVVAGLTGGGWWRLRDLTATVQEFRQRANSAEKDRRRSEDLALLGRQLSYADAQQLAAAALRERLLSDVPDPLEKGRPSPGGGRPRLRMVFPEPVRSANPIPQGSRVAGPRARNLEGRPDVGVIRSHSTYGIRLLVGK